VTADGIGFSNYVRYIRNFPKSSAATAVAATTTATTVLLARFLRDAPDRDPSKYLRFGGAVAAVRAVWCGHWVSCSCSTQRVINRTFNLGIDIYGFWGIVISDTFYSFPHAYLILSAALAVADARLYESAQVLGATGARIFRDITLPSTKYGILSATFVVFTIVITDFGNPMVIGGDFNVLATEIYNQVSGQGNFSMGAVIGVMLLVPAALAVIAEKWIMRRHHATITERSQPLSIHHDRWRPGGTRLGGVISTDRAIVLVVVGQASSRCV
jgi:iron(III) transport system permease protein